MGDGAPQPIDDDVYLVELARSDPAAFAQLYRRYVDAVYRYALSRLDSREAAEDATSQIFLKALSSLPAHRAGSSFRAWLFTIAHNVITDTYRSRRRHDSIDQAVDHPDGAASPEDQALQRAQHDEVRAMLRLLPEDQRRIMELRLAGLTGAEIAIALGKNLGAVKMAQSRAIARLRDALLNDQENANVHV